MPPSLALQYLPCNVGGGTVKFVLSSLFFPATVWALCVRSASAQDEKKAPSLRTDQSVDQLAASPALKLKMPGPEVQNLMLGTWAIKTEYARSKETQDGGTGE